MNNYSTRIICTYNYDGKDWIETNSGFFQDESQYKHFLAKKVYAFISDYGDMDHFNIQINSEVRPHISDHMDEWFEAD